MTRGLASPQGGVRTTCPYCGVGCGVVATPDKAGGAAIAGDIDHPANMGALCVKGSALGETLATDGRLLHPLINRQRTTWNRALSRTAAEFGRVAAEHGPDSVAFYLSGQLLTEDYYVANKLMKGFIGSANVDTNSRLCMASSVAGHKRAFGADLVPGCYEDLDEADLVVLTGSNAAWCHPVLFQRIQRARERRGTYVINIDPRRTATAEGCDLQLSIAPGQDGALFSWLLVEIARSPAFDAAYVAARTSGFDAALAAAAVIAPDLDAVAARTGLAAHDITTFTQRFIGTPRAVTCYSQGVNQSAQGVDKVNAIINCHLATGRVATIGAGPLSLTGQPNAMGGREVGGLANQLAAHMGFAERDIDRVRRFWGAPRMAQAEGRKAVDLFDAVASGAVKALWIMCTNPAVSLPQADRVRGSLAQLEFLAVSESHAHVDGLLEAAHVAFPAAPWGEKDGTVTNSERRISRQRAFLPAAGEAKPDWWIVTEVARRMGFGKAFPYTNASQIFAEHAALSGFENAGSRAFDISAMARMTAPEFDAMTPTQWPRAHNKPADAKRVGRFFTPDGRANFIAIAEPRLAAALDDAHPFRLNTGRIRDQWHTMTRTGLSPRLARHIQEPFVELAPSDAARLGVSEGDYVRVSNRNGAVTLAAKLDGGRAGEAFAPIHWTDAGGGRARVGALVHGVVDPLSGQPESKAVPVAIERVAMRAFGFIVSRQRMAAPAWLVHARIAIESGDGAGAEALTFAAPIAPEALDAHMSNFLPTGRAALRMRDATAGVFRHALLVGGRLHAALYIAPAREPAALEHLIALMALHEIDPAARRGLLAGRGPGASIDLGPQICACRSVRRATIEAAIEAGAASLDLIGVATGAGSQCGSCRPELGRLLTHARALA